VAKLGWVMNERETRPLVNVRVPSAKTEFTLVSTASRCPSQSEKIGFQVNES
jgi:hypothetical protein